MTSQAVFLTGVTGFIGSHIARQLLNEQMTIYALVRDTSDLWRIQDLVNDLNIIPGDVLHPASYRDALKDIAPDIGIHAAWNATGQYLESPLNLDLLHASLDLVNMLDAVHCKRFIGIGTCFEYDTQAGYLSDDFPLKPHTLYGASKASLSLLLSNLPLRMSVAWLRLFQPYGIYENPTRLIPQVVSHLVQNKPVATSNDEQLRDFIHVGDIARAVSKIAKTGLEGNFNVGCGEATFIRVHYPTHFRKGLRDCPDSLR